MLNTTMRQVSEPTCYATNMREKSENKNMFSYEVSLEMLTLEISNKEKFALFNSFEPEKKMLFSISVDGDYSFFRHD